MAHWGGSNFDTDKMAVFWLVSYLKTYPFGRFQIEIKAQKDKIAFLVFTYCFYIIK